MKPLAVLGTGSDAGKTSLVMALCRIFADQGLKVAPFKAQNVSNNSAVTQERREISRAQCLQAEAARVEPSYLFNPILLKSHGNGSVQVIVNGLVHKKQTITAYYDELDELKLQVQQSFSRLQQDYDLVIAEGAGSPVELNLLDKDLSNTFVANTFNTINILVADIERGGVFASIYGTMALMDPVMRSNLSGVVINKFRGDRRLFDEGEKIIRDRFGLNFLAMLQNSVAAQGGTDTQRVRALEQVMAPQVLDRLVMAEVMKEYASAARIRVSEAEVDRAIEEANRGLPGGRKMEDAIVQGRQTRESLRETVRIQLLERKVADHVTSSVVVVADQETTGPEPEPDPAAIGAIEATGAPRPVSADSIANEVRLSCIYIRCAEDAPASATQAARARAEAALAEVSGGMDFAEAARRFSEDPRSAARGGDPWLHGARFGRPRAAARRDGSRARRCERGHPGARRVHRAQTRRPARGHQGRQCTARCARTEVCGVVQTGPQGGDHRALPVVGRQPPAGGIGPVGPIAIIVRMDSIAPSRRPATPVMALLAHRNRLLSAGRPMFDFPWTPAIRSKQSRQLNRVPAPVDHALAWRVYLNPIGIHWFARSFPWLEGVALL